MKALDNPENAIVREFDRAIELQLPVEPADVVLATLRPREINQAERLDSRAFRGHYDYDPAATDGPRLVGLPPAPLTPRQADRIYRGQQNRPTADTNRARELYSSLNDHRKVVAVKERQGELGLRFLGALFLIGGLTGGIFASFTDGSPQPEATAAVAKPSHDLVIHNPLVRDTAMGVGVGLGSTALGLGALPYVARRKARRIVKSAGQLDI